MTTIIIVDKTGTIKEKSVQLTGEDDLYKKAGFKTKTDFKKHTEWTIDDLNGKAYVIEIYGKTTGVANQENKYEFPPPIDNVLFFGSCIIVNKINDKLTDITCKEWETIYEFLYGGFENVDGEESIDDSDDTEEDLPTTKYGYVKDGFVVDDDEEEDEVIEEEAEEEDEAEDDEEEEHVFKKVKSAKKRTAATVRKNAATKIKKPEIKVVEEQVLLECSDELTEEEYISL